MRWLTFLAVAISTSCCFAQTDSKTADPDEQEKQTVLDEVVAAVAKYREDGDFKKLRQSVVGRRVEIPVRVVRVLRKQKDYAISLELREKIEGIKLRKTLDFSKVRMSAKLAQSLSGNNAVLTGKVFLYEDYQEPSEDSEGTQLSASSSPPIFEFDAVESADDETEQESGKKHVIYLRQYQFKPDDRDTRDDLKKPRIKDKKSGTVIDK